MIARINVKCYDYDFYYNSLVVVLPLAFIYFFALPLLFFILLFKNRNNLTNESIMLKYEYLLREYKKNAFYWEFFKMINRMIIVWVINYYS
jgi:hypothetical protein